MRWKRKRKKEELVLKIKKNNNNKEKYGLDPGFNHEPPEEEPY